MPEHFHDYLLLIGGAFVAVSVPIAAVRRRRTVGRRTASVIGRVVACEPAGWNGPIAPGRRYVATVEYEVDGRLYVLRKRCRTGWRPIVGAAPIVHHASENPRDAGIESVRTSAGHDATLAVALALLGLAAVAVGLVGTGP